VFHHHPNVRPEIRERVFAVARENGYSPRLASKQRNVVILAPGEAIYPIRNCLEMVMMALTQELPKRRFRIEILPQEDMDRLNGIQFCGAVAIGAEPGDFVGWSARFPVPLVLVDRDAPKKEPNVYSVRSDETQGMDLAIGHLHDRGCRSIGCIIHGQAGTGNVDERRAAVARALQTRGLPANDALIYLSEDDNYVELVGKLLQQGVDALFCPGGNAGIVTAYALSLFNRRVPDDISVIASEHKLFSRYATPPQTTITQDHDALAQIVADLIESCDGDSPPPRRSILPYSLIPRDSVRHP
jgi:LacI family transcriptional regulator